MNEEYLKKVFGTLNLDESHYEAFKNDMSTNEEYSKKVFGTLNLDESHYEAFKNDTGFINPEEPKKENTEVANNIDLDSNSASVNSKSLLESKFPTSNNVDLKKKLEDKLISSKDGIKSPKLNKFRSIDELEELKKNRKDNLEKDRVVLDDLPDKGFEYKEKASKKLTDEYMDAYKHSNVDWKITDDQITREAINLRNQDLDDELYENTDMVEQAKLKLKSGSLRALSGIAGIPNFINKTMFTVMASDEELEAMNKLTPKQREVVLGGLSSGYSMSSLPLLSSQSQNYLKSKADEVENKIVQFNNSIGEDFTNLNFGKAFSRIGTEGAQMTPMLVQTMIPYVGLASVVAGEISNKQESLEDEGYGLGLDTTTNSIINGAVVGISEAFTKKLGGKIFKTFQGLDDTARESMLQSMKKMVVNANKEGLTEFGEETMIKISDALIQGKEGQFDNYWKEMADVYILGGAMGGTLSATPSIIRQTKNLIDEHKTNKIISSKDNDYNDLSDVFKGTNSVDRINISSLHSTNIRLDKVLDKKISAGEINQQKADKIKSNFLNTKEALTKLNKVKLSNEGKVKAVDLLIKKRDLVQEMKNTDEAFHPTYKEKIEAINEEIRKTASIKDVEPTKNTVKTETKTNEGKVETKVDKKVEYTVDEVSEVTDAKVFSDSQNTAINNRTNDKLQVTPMTEQDAQTILDEGGKLFMTSDGKSGAYVKKDGYMGGLFKDPTANRSQAAKVLQEVRTKAGGKFFDAFGTHLEDIYIKNGFRPVVRMTFNEEYAPEGWQDTNLKNKPDNVFFVYDPSYKASKGEGIRNEDYDQAYDIAKNYKPNESNTKETEGGTTTNKTGAGKSTDGNVQKRKFFTGRKKKVSNFKKTKGEFIFFSTKKEVAETYGEVTEASLNTDNFIDLTSQDKKSKIIDGMTDEEVKNTFNIKRSERSRFPKSLKEEINNFRERVKEGSQKFTGDGDIQNNFLRFLKNKGYDGVILQDTHYGKYNDSYVVFNKNKINELNKNPDVDIKKSYKKTADEIRKLKVNQSVKDAMSKLQSNPVAGLFTGVWDGAIETVAKSVELTGDIHSAVEQGVQYIKKTDWYKSLSQEGKDEAVKMFKENGLKDYRDNITPEQAFNKSRAVAKNSRKESAHTKDPIVKRLRDNLSGKVDKYLDRQGSVKKALKKIGLDKVVDYMVTKSGASSLAKNKVEEAYKKTFHNLTNEEIELLEEIIQHKRTISIGKNRTDRGLEQIKRQGDVTVAEATTALEGYREKLGDDLYNKLDKRADNYFTEYKSLLKGMLDEGLINQDFYDEFVDIDYKPTQYLKFLEDMDGTFLESEADKNNDFPLSGKQIQTITKGSTTNELMDAWGIMQKSILSRTKAVFNNRVNKTFVNEFVKTKKQVDALRGKESLTKAEQKIVSNFENVEANIKLDKVVGFTDGGNVKYKLAGKNTKGYNSLYYYENGIKKRILMKEDFFNKFTDTNNSLLSGTVRENIALATGTSTVKSLATGNNPLFFLTNTPRDFMFTLTFSKEYGNEILSNSVKLAVDMVKGVKDVVSNSDNYKLYLEYGGGMDYLALQGKYREKGWTKTMVDNILNQKTQDKITRNKFKRFMDTFNLASEVGIRLAVFNRGVKNQLNGRDIESLNKDERDLIYTKAVRSARELTDFNQGGKVTKAVDAGIPYLNAAIQGTRAATKNLNERPIETLGRITQMTAYSTASVLAMSMGMISAFRGDDEELSNSDIYFKTIEGVSQYDLQNYFIIPLGKKDDKGNWKYMRVAKAQALTPFINASEHFMRKQLSKQGNVKYNGDLGEIMSNTVKNNILPIDPNPLKVPNRVPLVDAGIAWMGYDSYTGNPLSWDKGKIPAELEGIVDDRVQPMFKKIGLELGESPLRLQSAIESFVTTPSTNPYIGIAYSLGNLTTSLVNDDSGLLLPDMDKELFDPALRRLVKSTSEYNKVDKLKKKVSGETLTAYRKHIVLEDKVRNSIKEVKNGNRDLKSTISDFLTEYPDDKVRLESWMKSEYKKVNKSYLTSSLKFEKNKEVRALILSEKFGNSILDIKNMDVTQKKIVQELYNNGVLDDETMMYYKKLVSN